MMTTRKAGASGFSGRAAHTLLMGGILGLTWLSGASAANVSGRVVTTNGVGIPSIDIDVIDRVTGTPLDILDDDSDADGSFDFLVPDGRYLVRFQAVNGQPLVSLEFDDWLLQGVVNWTVTMEVGAFLSGTVEGSSGQPVPNADVRLIRRDLESSVHSPTDETDLAGAFTVVVPTGTAIGLTVKPPAGNDFLALETEVDPLSGPVNLGTLALQSGHRVSGRVRSGGSGVDRVNIDAFRTDGTAIPLGHDKTNATGDFEIVIPDGEFEILARPRVPNRLAPARSSPFNVSGDRTVGDLVVSAGVLLSGTVTDPLGDGVPEAEVSLATPPATSVDVSGGRANAAGYYELVAAIGVYDITVTAPEYRNLRSSTMADYTLDGDSVLNLALADQTPISGVSEFVAWEYGNRVQLQWTVMNLQRLRAFRVFRVRPGTGELTAIHPGWLRPGTEMAGFSFEGSETRGRLTLLDHGHWTGARYILEALTGAGQIEREGPILPARGLDPVTPAVPAVSLRVVPNPAIDAARVIIRSPLASASAASLDPGIQLEIFDLTGRRLLVRDATAARETANGGIQWELDGALRRWAPGVYLVRVQTPRGSVSTKLLRADP